MDFNTQGAGGWIGAQVGLGVRGFSRRCGLRLDGVRRGIRGRCWPWRLNRALPYFLRKLSALCFGGAVGDDFEGVVEVLAAVRELLEPVFFWELLYFDMPSVFFALSFERADGGGFFFDLSPERFGFCHVVFDGFGIEAFSEGEVA